MTDREEKVIEKQNELLIKYQNLTRWLLKYNLDAERSQRGKDFLKDIDNLQSELNDLQKLPDTNYSSTNDNSFGVVVIDKPTECDHENTDMKNVRCTVCLDCGELIEIDV